MRKWFKAQSGNKILPPPTPLLGTLLTVLLGTGHRVRTLQFSWFHGQMIFLCFLFSRFQVEGLFARWWDSFSLPAPQCLTSSPCTEADRWGWRQSGEGELLTFNNFYFQKSVLMYIVSLVISIQIPPPPVNNENHWLIWNGWHKYNWIVVHEMIHMDQPLSAAHTDEQTKAQHHTQRSLSLVYFSHMR